MPIKPNQDKSKQYKINNKGKKQTKLSYFIDQKREKKIDILH